MRTISNREMEHAICYTEEATKLFMFTWSKATFPTIFDQATTETRQATSDDYYVPPSIADECIVATYTSFDETACQRCKKLDPVHWLPLNQNHILAYQPACFDKSFNLYTEWRKGKFVQANRLKKIFCLGTRRYV
ncbi:hypothetical protein AVEN_103470-1 [Araneus ventricosus]|uniref:Uncharacterized protein n=1 Tax=Araneus ventricosus TaxID=182803 RepID=A0A4Y2MKH2_ARAVE|nr:hypothetical protein AVEN_103470-1 [Araneus ventricosus]